MTESCSEYRPLSYCWCCHTRSELQWSLHGRFGQLCFGKVGFVYNGLSVGYQLSAATLDQNCIGHCMVGSTLLFDIKEQSQRLVTFETFYQSDGMSKKLTKTKTKTSTLLLVLPHSIRITMVTAWFGQLCFGNALDLCAQHFSPSCITTWHVWRKCFIIQCCQKHYKGENRIRGILYCPKRSKCAFCCI